MFQRSHKRFEDITFEKTHSKRTSSKINAVHHRLLETCLTHSNFLGWCGWLKECKENSSRTCFVLRPIRSYIDNSFALLLRTSLHVFVQRFLISINQNELQFDFPKVHKPDPPYLKLSKCEKMKYVFWESLFLHRHCLLDQIQSNS